jgi:DNA modification methylase
MTNFNQRYLLQRTQMKYQILQGDNRDTLKTLADNSIDAIVTDPPYGIDFLGKSWDANTGALETYQECLRVLKPGGHIVAFSAARTYHHLAVTLEQAGFEIRDQIMWIYSSGFPKSQDIGRSIQRSLGVKETAVIKGGARPSDKQTGGRAKGKIEAKQEYSTPVLTDPNAKQWEGWGTALKPAHEPIALARKPLKQSIAKNCQQWGTGAININATRVGDEIFDTSQNRRTTQDSQIYDGGWAGKEGGEIVQGRYPSNVIGEIQEEYQKYFYCPKVSRKERHTGFDTTQIATNPNGMWDDGVQFQNQQAFSGNTEKGNNHPTVKPVALMEYLIKLITPPGGTVLDPFNGSGSTGMAAVGLGFNYIGCELDPAYVDIAEKRIAAWLKKDNNFSELFVDATE